jgi:hypothetical protein
VVSSWVSESYNGLLLAEKSAGDNHRLDKLTEIDPGAARRVAVNGSWREKDGKTQLLRCTAREDADQRPAPAKFPLF